MKMEEDECVENKQSTAASCSSVSEGSGSGSSFLKSPPAVASPPTVSPTHRCFWFSFFFVCKVYKFKSHDGRFDLVDVRRTSGPIRRAKGGWTTEEVTSDCFVLDKTCTSSEVLDVCLLLYCRMRH